MNPIQFTQQQWTLPLCLFTLISLAQGSKSDVKSGGARFSEILKTNAQHVLDMLHLQRGYITSVATSR